MLVEVQKRKKDFTNLQVLIARQIRQEYFGGKEIVGHKAMWRELASWPIAR